MGTVAAHGSQPWFRKPSNCVLQRDVAISASCKRVTFKILSWYSGILIFPFRYHLNNLYYISQRSGFCFSICHGHLPISCRIPSFCDSRHVVVPQGEEFHLHDARAELLASVLCGGIYLPRGAKISFSAAMVHSL